MSHSRLNQACGNSGIADQLLYHVTATRSDFVLTVMKGVLALKTDCTIKTLHDKTNRMLCATNVDWNQSVQ